ncbi:MAG: Bug family tripartite tricarboxylate transporter substrate binding protein [Beijerinckiaceae bacterium]
MNRTSVLAAATIFAAVSSPVHADSVADFYKGKTVTIVVPAATGGDYDLRSRLISRHLGRMLPGKPNVIVQNMPGGIGVVAANWLYLKAPRDGTALHMLFQNMPVLQAIKKKGVTFDVREFGWLGNTTNSPNVINSWHTTGITKIEDVYKKELVVGAPGTASTSYVYPAVMNEVLGTKFKIVTGYRGGSRVNIAMEKGEVGGRGSNSWASWKSGHPHWLKEKKIHILVQIGLKRAPDLKDVPLMLELAKNDKDRKYLTFLSSDMGISRPMVTTPGVPADRLAALKKAFKDTLHDKDFLTDAAKSKRDIEYSSGEEAFAIAKSMMEADTDVLLRASKLLGGTLK